MINREFIREDIVWKEILKILPEDSILFFDLEVKPLVTDYITPEHKIIGFGISYDKETVVFTGSEERILRDVNNYLSNKEIYLTVGYGSLYLDMPLLLNKLRKGNYKILRKIFNKAPHLDLAFFTTNYLYINKKIDNYKLVSLKDVVTILKLGELEQFSEDIYKDEKKLINYLRKDVENIRKLFIVLKENYFNKI